jgi:ubiquitination network signaling protein AcrB
MPRNPGAKKNQHNNRHENGLVGPGKRVTKQKSNGLLNGSPKGAVPDEPLTPAASHSPMTNHANNASSSSLSESKHDSAKDARRAGLKKRGSDSSYDAQDGPAGQEANGLGDAAQHWHGASTSKNKSSRDFNHLQVMSSILKSSPACDTVAILISLLALPSMILTIVQALFASLTLMPPSGVSPGSLLTLFDVFQGSAGAPSLGTMAIVDAICFGLWFCLWNWARNFALDLAQVQIAITLGSGSAGKSSTVNTACFAIILLLHSIRSKGVRQFFYSRLGPTKTLAQGRLAQLTQLLPYESDFGDNMGPPHWLRSLFAVHIISQALMAFVRRHVASTQRPSTSKTAKRTDTEALAGSQTSQDLPISDTATSTAVVTGSDYLSSAMASTKDGKDKSVSAKKKRRQANQVRSRQPFWAAIASTKVHVLREYEHKRGLSKAASGHDGSLDVSAKDELVWVTQIDPSSIQFEAANIAFSVQDQESVLPANYKPFFVRINGAKWPSVSADLLEDNPSSTDSPAQWSGEISGLAPNCTYTCSFVRAYDDEEFASVMVKTPAISDKEVSSFQLPVATRQSTRPSSPTTMIRNSIQTAEAKLNDARNRFLKTRRSHKTAMSKLEREVDSLNTRLKSSSDDTRQRQKLLQAERSIRQTEDATNSITTALDDLAAIPEEKPDEYNARKAAFEKQTQLLTASNETLTAAKSAAQNELSCVKNELNSVTARKERLIARQAKLNEQHDRINEANRQGLNEKDRKAAESAAKDAEQRKVEAEWVFHIQKMEQDINDCRARKIQFQAEVHAYERQAQSQRDLMLRNAGPLTPEGNLPGTNPPYTMTGRPLSFGYNQATTIPSLPLSPEVQHSPFLPFAKTTLSGETHRPRSDTNLSLGANSNFSIDFEDADPIPPMPTSTDFDGAGAGRKGSGSSRGKNNDSPGTIGMGPGSGGMGSPLKGTISLGNAHGHVSTW